MAVVHSIPRGISAAYWVPFLDASSEAMTTTTGVDSLGTPIPFRAVVSHGPSYPADESAATTEYVEYTLANGILVQVPKETGIVDGLTGDLKEGGSGGSGGGHKLRFTIAEFGQDFAELLPDQIGKMGIAVIAIGENVTTAQNGWYYLAGKWASGIEFEAAGETFINLPVEVVGQSFTTTDATADTAITYAPAAITPYGKTAAITPTPLVSGDLTRLKTGQIVVK